MSREGGGGRSMSAGGGGKAASDGGGGGGVSNPSLNCFMACRASSRVEVPLSGEQFTSR